MGDKKKPPVEEGTVDMEEIKEKLDAATQLAGDYLQLEKDFEEASKKANDFLAMAQRVQAEFENYRKRNASVRVDSIAEGRCEVVTALFPVMDNFERALNAMKEDNASREGVEMIYKQLVTVLSGLGCTISNPLGEVFDPNLHNAVMQSPAQEGEEPGSIVEVMQKGYTMEDKVLRYPMVRVAAEE